MGNSETDGVIEKILEQVLWAFDVSAVRMDKQEARAFEFGFPLPLLSWDFEGRCTIFVGDGEERAGRDCGLLWMRSLSSRVDSTPSEDDSATFSKSSVISSMEKSP
jgi:hypothetical protein